MMAAVSPRLRPLLRALRAQELRAPLWARGHNGWRGLGTKAAAVTPTSPMGPESPFMGQEKTLMGQTPVFVSFFLALQQMAAVPVPGLKGGGAAWITDLSSPDPTYALPLLTSATMWMVLEAGAESGVSSPHAGAVRAVLRVLPLLFLPMTVHFPAAIFVYWLTSNTFSLFQTLLLRFPSVRSALRIPAPPPSPPPGPFGVSPQRRDPAKAAEEYGRGPSHTERRETRMAAAEPLENGGQGAAPADVRAESVGSSRCSRAARCPEATLERNVGMKARTIKKKSRLWRSVFF
uniref:Membrane insertase YidC/Oxa/ALB C-terminal domain-containing protein n=1 Tax=Meleagris gallopavo TaxID=9103 RepID=A0A803YLM1_MELGA